MPSNDGPAMNLNLLNTVPRTVPGIVDRAADLYGDRVFLRDRSGPLLTFRSLKESAEHVAACLQGLGLKKGDRAAIMLPNSQHYLTIWLGILKAGLVEVPIHPANRGVVLHHQLSQSGTQILFTDSDGLASLQSVEGMSSLKRLVLVGDRADDPPTKSPYETGSFNQFLDQTVQFHPTEVVYSDVASVIYTSGTTGPSKGAVVAHNHNVAIARTTVDLVGATAADTLLLMFPLTHAGGKFGTSLTALLAGSTVYMEKFSASGFWDSVRRGEVTTFLYLGSILPLLWKQPSRPTDTDNTVSRAWGAAAPAHLIKPFEERFGLRLIEIYGQAETGNATYSRPGRDKLGSCGEAADHLEVAIVDQSDERCPPDEVGEIVVRPREPHTIVREYLNMPEETLRAFRNLWFHTGDRGRMDADGRLYFVDRLKDAIRRRGENISAWEVEQVVMAHPEVVEVAAYAIPSELGEDEVMIAVVMRAESTATPQDISHFCSSRMAAFSAPRFIRVVTSLPKNASERVQKYLLRDQGVTSDTWDRDAPLPHSG
jgi:crotonobetaine/carnitine-CoA ligase